MLMTSDSNEMLSNKNQRKGFKSTMKGWISFFNEVKHRMQNNIVDFWQN